MSDMTDTQSAVADDSAAADTADHDKPFDEARGFRIFMIIWVTQLVARLGNGLTAFGLAVQVYNDTGMSTSVAFVTMAAFLPGVLLAPIGGVLADRFDRRALMIFGDTASAIGLVILIVLYSTGTATLPLVLAAVAFSSVFTSVMDPAYRATISDLLTPKQYARASGLVQLAAASQFLISPAIAGLVMSTSGILLVLVLDISTMVVTITAMAVVVILLRRHKIAPPKAREDESNVWKELRFGITYFAENRGLLILMLLITAVTFCMGFLQTLLTPLMLDISNETVLGVVRSVAAIGMVVASLVIGLFNMGTKHRLYLSLALALAGITVVGMGLVPDALVIGVFAFLFFMTLPPLNTSVEVLVRASIPNETQGRIWGLMSLISQLGYVIAYGVSGPLADFVFNPLLVEGGPLADSLGVVLGVGATRGIGLMFVLVGIMLIATALVFPRLQSLHEMEQTLIARTAEAAEQNSGIVEEKE